MVAKQHFTTEQAREVGDKLGIDWTRLNLDQFRMGLDVEFEHSRGQSYLDMIKVQGTKTATLPGEI